MELKNKKILIGLCSVLAIVGGLFYGYETAKKEIKIISNKEAKEISTFKYTIDEVIKEHNLKFDKNDIINLTLNENKKENAKLDTKLEDNMVIELVNVSKGTISEYKEIDFETKVVSDKNLLKGKSVVSQEGEKGKNSLVYDVVYHNGKLVEKNFSKELVSKKPQDKIIKKGTKVVEEVVVATARGENMKRESKTSLNTSTNNNSDKNSNDSSNTVVASSNSSSGNHMSVVSTAYAGDTITATGTVPKWGTIAVDPRIIPYGTRVYIPQFGQTFIAEDCGGAIKGNKIDIFMNSEGKAYDWGRRTIDIYIQG
ncbi:G5 domain-containing protein [[Eubacterium] tenue]|nr:G5 domain-containing protein [[Eubacterium] tenue]MBC8630601.1 G5 domain-containing protein [[Eubacterium] tenue]